MDREQILQKLENLDKFRFHIEDEESVARSSTWFVRDTRGSLYIAPRGLGSAMKLSIHPRGGARDGLDTQFGLTAEEAKKQLTGGYTPPKLLRWKRTPPPSNGVTKIAAIIFPSDSLQTPVPRCKERSKLKFALPVPPHGQVIEVGIFTTLLDPLPLEESFQRAGFTPMICFQLAEGESAIIAARQTDVAPFGPLIRPPTSGRSSPMSGMPEKGEQVEARGLVYTDAPEEGGTFAIAELGAVSFVAPGPFDAPPKQ